MNFACNYRYSFKSTRPATLTCSTSGVGWEANPQLNMLRLNDQPTYCQHQSTGTSFCRLFKTDKSLIHQNKCLINSYDTFIFRILQTANSGVLVIHVISCKILTTHWTIYLSNQHMSKRSGLFSIRLHLLTVPP